MPDQRRRPSEAWIRGLPKAEVHLHLEGCVPLDVLDPSMAGEPAPVPFDDGTPILPDLASLLAYLDWSCGQIDRGSQLERIAYAVTERAGANGAGHVDVIVNPTHWPHWRGRLPAMVEALDAGFHEGETDHDVTAKLCVSLKRTQSREEALATVDTLLEMRHPRIAALSIDGNEEGGRASHNERFAPAFERAAAGGLRRCAHAGESSGPEGVREAVEILGAERIDHGIRCIEDPGVMSLLVDNGIPLDVCPTSNVLLGVVPSLAEHPLRQLRESGVRCSLNTDDPLLYGIDLAGEYQRTADCFGWGTDGLGEMARVGIESCFAEDERRLRLSKQLSAYLSAE
jgi:adenosine deaminase